MAGGDDDSAAWAAEFAAMLARQAAAALELFSLIATEAGDTQPADEEPADEGTWLRSAERLEALWRQLVQDQSEAFVAAWPDFVRELTGLLPLLSRGQPLFAMLAQLWPLLVGPAVLGRAIETRGESLVGGLEQFLAGLGRSQHAEEDAGDPSGRDQALP